MRDFQGTAAKVVRDRPDWMPCLPAIEKEILHLEILRAMHDAGLLRELTFKGGTCLRLCYGAEHLSENLDFSGGARFDGALLGNIEDVLRMRIGERYGLEVSVRPPKPAGEQPGRVNRWVARIVTRPPSAGSRVGVQRIKIEIDDRAAEPDDAPRLIRCRHSVLAPDFTTFPVRSASLQDVRAAKMVAYPMSVLTRDNPRHRDVWDIAWFSEPPGTGAETATRAAGKAIADGLQGPLREALRKTASRSDALVASDGFQETLRRFLPESRALRITGDESHRQALAATVREFCAEVLAALPQETMPPEAENRAEWT